jgi:hypothetical protein
MSTDADPTAAFAKELAQQIPVKAVYSDAIAPAAKQTGHLAEDIVKTIHLALAPLQFLTKANFLVSESPVCEFVRNGEVGAGLVALERLKYSIRNTQDTCKRVIQTLSPRELVVGYPFARKFREYVLHPVQYCEHSEPDCVLKAEPLSQ